MSSVMLRGWSAIARHDECEAIDRRLGDRQHVAERLVGDVRDVDHHAEPVQLADDVLAERRQAVVRRLVGGRVGPVVVLEMRQRQVADAERGVLAQDAAGRRRSCGRLPSPSAPRSCARRRPRGPRRRWSPAPARSGCAAHRLVHRVDQLHRALHRLGPVTSLGTQIEKNSASSPPSRMRGMSMLPFFWRTADVEGLVEEQPLRGVVVRVDDDGPRVDLGWCRR